MKKEKYETVDAWCPMRMPVLEMINLTAGSGLLLRAENWEPLLCKK